MNSTRKAALFPIVLAAVALAVPTFMNLVKKNDPNAALQSFMMGNGAQVYGTVGGEDAAWRDFVGAESQRDLIGLGFEPRLLKRAASLRSPGSLESGRLRRVTVKLMRQIPSGTVFTGAGIIVARTIAGGSVILTARHVIDSGRIGPLNPAMLGTLHVLGEPTAQNLGYPARIVGISDVGDLALVSSDLPVSDAALATLADSEPSVDARALVVGHPHGDAWVVSPAIYHPRLGHGSILCPTCFNGDSGGAVFDSTGSAFGIIVERKVWHLGFDGPRNKAHDAITMEFEPLPVIRRLLSDYESRLGETDSIAPWTMWPFDPPLMVHAAR